MKLTHSKAVLLMIAATLMWSIAGVVTRQLESARSFETTFWRSFFTVVSLLIILPLWQGRGVFKTFHWKSASFWISGVCWSVMFTAFMVALTLTTVANVLITLALGPLFTALLAWMALGHRLAPRTWGAIALAGAGIAWMYGHEVSGDPRHLAGMGVALAVPVAAAINWTLLQHLKGQEDGGSDMLPAVLVGAAISALATLPLAWPFAASMRDVSLLALLGVVQLAIPCLMAVAVARVLPGPEISLLALLEVLFGVAWAWLGAGEAPNAAVLGGGLLVLLALAGNEWLALRSRQAA